MLSWGPFPSSPLCREEGQRRSKRPLTASPLAYGETDGESRGLTRQHLSHLSLKRGVPGGCWGAWGMASVPLVRALAQTQGSGSDDPGAEAPPEVLKSKNLVPHSTLQPPLKPHLRLPRPPLCGPSGTAHRAKGFRVLKAGPFICVCLWHRPPETRCRMSETNSFKTLSSADIKVDANWVLFSSKDFTDFTAAECFHTFVKGTKIYHSFFCLQTHCRQTQGILAGAGGGSSWRPEG